MKFSLRLFLLITVLALTLTVVHSSLSGKLTPLTSQGSDSLKSPQEIGHTVLSEELLLKKIAAMTPLQLLFVNLVALSCIGIFFYGIYLDTRFLYQNKNIALWFNPAEKPLSSLNGKDILMLGSILFFFYAMTKLLAALIIIEYPKTHISVLLSLQTIVELALITIVLSCEPIAAFIRQRKTIISLIKQIFKTYSSIIPLILGISLANLMLFQLLKIPAKPMPVVTLLQYQNDPFALGLIIILAVILAPVLEELLFRGIIYGFLRKKQSLGFSCLVTSLLFALMHTHIFSFIPLFALGVAFSLTYERTRNILIPIGLHAVHNGCMLILFFYSQSLLN